MARSAIDILRSYQSKPKPYTGLKVTTKPTYTGTLKVKPYKPPTTKLKVTTKPVNYVTPRTYNPQRTAPSRTFQRTYNPQPSTKNPQKTASSNVLKQKQAKDWAKKQAKLLRIKTDRLEAERKLKIKRIADAKNIEIQGQQGNWFDKLKFQGDTSSRNARTTAYEYARYNNDTVFPNLLARKRNFEVEQAKRYQDAYDRFLKAGSKKEEDAIRSEFDDWWKRTSDEWNTDYTNYMTEQEQLMAYAGQPLSSLTGKIGSTIKKTGEEIWGTGWTALKKGGEIFERGVNTTKNIVNPNNLRMYYGGEEKKGGLKPEGSSVWQRLKNAYNASNDQRIVGFSKDDEAERLRKIDQGLANRKEGKNIFGGSTTKGFLRGGGVDKFRVKYGDDIVNFMLDPMNLLPNNWLAKGGNKFKNSKAVGRITDKAFDFSSKNRFLSDALISREARKVTKSSNKSGLMNWLSSPKNDYGRDKLDDFYNRVPQVNQAKSQAFENISEYKRKLNPHWDTFNRFTGDKEKHLTKWADDYDNLKNLDTDWLNNLKHIKKQYPSDLKDLQRYMSQIDAPNGNFPMYTLKKADDFSGLDDMFKGLTPRQKFAKQSRLRRTATRMRGTYDKLYETDIKNLKGKIRNLSQQPFLSSKQKEMLKELKDELYDYRQGYFAKSKGSHPISKLGGNKGDSISAGYRKQQKTYDFLNDTDFISAQNKRVYGQLMSDNPRLKDMFDERKRVNYNLKDAYKRAKGADNSKFIQDTFSENKDRIYKNTVGEFLSPTERLTDGFNIVKPKPDNYQKFEKKINKFGRFNLNTKQKPSIRHSLLPEKKANWWNKKSRNVSGRPMDWWTKSVLTANPAWYVNNFGTNAMFTGSAGGLDAYIEAFKLLKSPSYRRSITSGLPAGVTGSIDEFVGGKAGRFTSLATDEIPRIASFLSQKKKGLSDKDALKVVNDWFFDYSVKNYERGAKAVSPFYKWQLGLMGLSAKMPFKYPRSSKVYNTAYQTLFDRPLDQLPKDNQKYIDPDTGQEAEYNPRETYKGKLYTGRDKDGQMKFRNTPFFAMNPNTITEFGMNPFLGAFTDLSTSKDKWGRPTTDKSTGRLLADKFPQASLYNKFKERNQRQSSNWFSPTGYGKFKQGWDQDAPNYDKYLDKNETFKSGLKSFVGIPAETKFDPVAYDQKIKFSKFNESFFGTDWEKRRKELTKKEYYDYDDPENPYNVIDREQKALAKKNGLSWKEVEKNWSKYDTKTAVRTKSAKDEARQWSGDFWQDYLSIPQGSRTKASERRPYLIKKYKEWGEDRAFAKNGYRRLPEFSVYDEENNDTGKDEVRSFADLKREQSDSVKRRAEGKKKYQRYLEYQKAMKSGDWSFFGDQPKSKRQLEYQKAEKTGDWSWFNKKGNGFTRSDKSVAYKKAKASGDWTEYNKQFGDSRKQSPFQYDGKFFNSQETMDKYKVGALWQEYYALENIADKQAFLDEHPELGTFDRPETQEEWDLLKTKLKKERNKKLAGVDGFTANRESIKKQIERTAPRGFGGKRRLKYKF